MASSERHLTRTAVFVILERDGKVFLLRRANTGWADGYFTLPSGHVDKGDMPRDAAAKEVREEACVEVAPDDLEFVHVDYKRDKYVNFYFKAKNWEGEPKVGEPHLASEAVWVDAANLPSDTISQVKNVLGRSGKDSFYSEGEDGF